MKKIGKWKDRKKESKVDRKKERANKGGDEKYESTGCKSQLDFDVDTKGQNEGQQKKE